MNDKETADKSRRSFLKKGALASGAAALGIASSSGSASAQNQVQTRPQDTALVFTTDYNPGVPWRMVSKIQQPTVNAILGNQPQQQQGGGQQQQQQGPPVDDPTDWNGYIFNYTGCGPGNYNLTFLREGNLQQGQTYRFTTNAVYFNNSLQLLETEIRAGGGGGGGGGGGNTTGGNTSG